MEFEYFVRKQKSISFVETLVRRLRWSRNQELPDAKFQTPDAKRQTPDAKRQNPIIELVNRKDIVLAMDSNVLNVNELELIGEGKTKRIYALKKDNDKVRRVEIVIH